MKTSPGLATKSLGGVALQGRLDVGCMMMHVRKDVMLSGVVVASTVGLARSMR